MEWGLRRLDVLRRISFELLQAALAAEAVGLTGVFEARGGLKGHAHSANWID
jgi:hypothetical protein